VLELIVKRGRALVEARDVLILLAEGDELRVAAGAGSLAVPEGVRLPIGDSPIASLMSQPHAQRVADPERRLGVRLSTLGVPDAEAALIVPLVYRGATLGALMAFDRLTATSASRMTTSSCSRRSPRAPPPPSRRRRPSRPTGCASRWRRPRPSAAAGPASCTTRRSRGSAA
jgi:hypothetical protein